ncbi:tryptophan--tRNA ligase [Candidatus Woesearchaeota archaeon]|nr:tryptophan--tRNA ligase [Candidatus Woesearchaeota archaeon]
MAKFKLTPWEVEGDIDYERLVSDFGVSYITDKIKSYLQDSHPLLRREVYFAHRDFDKWINAYESGKKVSVITGRGPSERMHIGHLVPFMVAKALQDKFNCEVYIPISDDEKFYVKEDLSFDNAVNYSKENILDLIALGFNPKKTFIFRDFEYTSIYLYAAKVAKRINYSMAKSVFGLKPEHNIGWSFYPAMQTAHILFPQFNVGAHFTVTPVGIDQDPFLRIARDVAVHKDFKFEKPTALHAKFIPSLAGSAKMSSSGDHVIFLTDSAKEVKRKINKYAFSGGQATIEEHRAKGGDPDVDISYQYLRMFFESDDQKLKEIHDNYKSGNLLSGELKKILIDKINVFLEEHQKKREDAKKIVDLFLLKNK